MKRSRIIIRRILGIGLCLVVMVMGIAISSFLPVIGDPNSPANTHISPEYIKEAPVETNSPNLVTAVLADYRAFDTLLETTVLFTSGLCVMVILVSHLKGGRGFLASPRREKRLGADVEVIVPVLVPVIILYGFYVLFHGEISLGGGFQAGALLAIAYILVNFMGTRRSGYRMSKETAIRLSALGVLIYALVGIVPMFFGGNLLEYGELPIDVHHAERHSIGILGIEFGVTLGVMSTIIAILEAGLEGGDLDV